MKTRTKRSKFLRARVAAAVLALGLGYTAGTARAGAQVVSPPGAAPKWGFDACEVPALDVMRAWAGVSPYDTVAAYIGGTMRACPNAALGNPTWMTETFAMGWNVIPVIVDAQAPCTDYHVRISTEDPAVHAYLMSLNTVASARAAGLSPGDPIYLDMEPWKDPDPACADLVRKFVEVWAQSLRGQGYVPGLYSTGPTGIATVINVPGIVDAVWVALWNDAPGSMGDASAPSWAGRRIHQYRGDHEETWAGQTLAIDSNWIDGPVAEPRGSAVPSL